MWKVYSVVKRDQREYHKIYYDRRREARKLQVLTRQQIVRDEVTDYKKSRGCDICGYARSARSLQFHHTADDKKHDVARMVGRGRSRSSIFEEIKKCALLCANCHGEVHDGILILET